MTYWKLISTGDPVQTGDPVGSDRITTSPGTGETGNGPVGHLNLVIFFSFLETLPAGEHLGGNIVMNVDKRIYRFVLVRDGARVERSMRHHDTTMRQRIFYFIHYCHCHDIGVSV
jgi:hypothetical protein